MVLYPVPGAVGSTQLPSFSVSGVCHMGIPEISVGAERLQQERLHSLELHGGNSW